MWDIKRCLQGLTMSVAILGMHSHLPRRGKNSRTSASLATVFALIMLSSDLEYVANKWKLAHWASHVRPCTLCKANFTSECHMFDFSMSAAWFETCLTLDEWAANPISDHPVFAMWCLTAFNLCPDVAHTLHQGVYLHIIGNVLVLLVDAAPGADKEQRLAYVNNSIQASYTMLGVPHSDRAPHN